METTIKTIDRLAAALKKLQPLKPEYQQRLDKKIRLEFNYNSNHIEGNTLTYGETELLLIFDKTTGNHELREYEEMKSHDIAFEMIKEWAEDHERPLSEMALKNLHEVLLVRPFWKEAITADGQPTRRQIKVGTYKEFPNSVRLQNGEIFHYSSPEETPMQMGELIEWFRSEEEKKDLHPVTLAALLHYKFVRIHPFDDGNGRISRLLMNYVLLRHGLPPVVIKSTDKKAYLFALNQADAGDLNAFIEYVSEQALQSIELSIKAANGETLEEEDDWEKKLALLKRQQVKAEKVISKSAASIWDVIYTSILPTIDKILERFSGFNELFAEKRILVGNKQTNFVVENKEQIIKLITIDNNKYMNDIQFVYELNGYMLDKTNTFNANIQLSWSFTQFKYFFFLDHYDHQKAEERLYKQAFSEEEINKIASECGKRMMDKIEERTNKSK